LIAFSFYAITTVVTWQGLILAVCRMRASSKVNNVLLTGHVIYPREKMTQGRDNKTIGIAVVAF